VACSRNTGNFFLLLYKDGLQIGSISPYSVVNRYKDATIQIELNNGADFYQGFIWTISLHNSVIDAAQIAGKVKAVAVPQTYSSVCPFVPIEFAPFVRFLKVHWTVAVLVAVLAFMIALDSSCLRIATSYELLCFLHTAVLFIAWLSLTVLK